uniref:Bifunctional inhibitor/plant lipid transfer protein/seed storage helical domain-containing protein n=1 Tax=Leersia perrieri TaxID=77586 RepID=A0A0D9XYD0_9ORYZ
MKIILITTILAIAATTTFAQFDVYSQVYGQYQLQQQFFNPCGEFVRQQCSSVAFPFLQSPLWSLRSCRVMQQQCCQHLRLIMA